MGPANRLRCRFGQAEVPDFAFGDQVADRSGNLLNGNIRIDPVLVEQVDRIHIQSFERCFCDFPDMFRPAVQLSPLSAFVRIGGKTEFCGDNDVFSERGKRFPDQFLVRERPIYFGSIEESDTAFDSTTDDRDHFLFVFGRTVTEAHSHTTQTNGRYFRTVLSQLAFLHHVVSFVCCPLVLVLTYVLADVFPGTGQG